MNARFAGIALAFALNAATAWAEFKVPPMVGPVNDYAGLISADDKNRMDSFLRALVNNGGSQIAVLTVEDLGGTTVEEASIKVTDAWKLGSAKGDNGVLLLIAKNDHALRIEVGQGLEGVLTDAYSKRIIDRLIVPDMRAGNYSGGIVAGVNGILAYTDPKAGQIGNPPRQARAESDDGGGRRGFGGLPFGLKALIMIAVLLWIFTGGGGGGYRRRGIFWTGGGGFGSGGGGGWSGGGGGFSGGGASGKW